MVGKQISHYKILEEIGRGGMGVVYKARDLKLDRFVALKFLPTKYTSDTAVKERFIQEAKAASALDHSNICTIHEIDETEDAPAKEMAGKHMFIVMSYYEGETLKERIEQGPVALDDALDIAAQIGRGLAKAHELNIVHRDIKPANIFLTVDGSVKILDFGLAKLCSRTKLTKESTTLGTVAYMSPEQTRGEEVDHRTDIWSLGVVLYEMLTQTIPFKGEYEQAIIYSILNEEPQPIAHLPSAPATKGIAIEQIIHTCLAKNIHERYSTIADFLADIYNIEFDANDTKIEVQKKSWPQKSSLKKYIFPAIFLLIVLGCIAGFMFIRGINKSDRLSRYPVAEKTWQNSIAVLPFADMSPEQDQEFFCDGMAEEIINDLSNVGNLRVIARTSAFAFKDQIEDVREIGKKLNVETLLEGSVRKSGNQLRVVVRLVQSEDGAQIWSHEYDRNLTDVFEIQDEIALEIVNRLKITLIGDEATRIASQHTDDLEAYNHYLKGRHLLNRRKKQDIYAAISYFERALALDSLYVFGYIGLADAYALLPSYASAPEKTAYPQAKRAISMALNISDQIGEAYASLGWISLLADWDYAGAEGAFEKAVSLNPGYATAYHWFGYLYMILGQFEKTYPLVTRALELDPLSPVLNRVIGDVYRNARQYDKAIPAFQKTLELEPCIPFGHSQLGLCYLQKSMYEEAFDEFLRERECREDSNSTDYLFGLIYAKKGEEEKAREILNQLIARGADGSGTAQVYFALGDNENGLKILEEMYENRDTWLLYIHSNPEFDAVRAQPRFKKIIKQMGLDK